VTSKFTASEVIGCSYKEVVIFQTEWSRYRCRG